MFLRSFYSYAIWIWFIFDKRWTSIRFDWIFVPDGRPKADIQFTRFLFIFSPNFSSSPSSASLSVDSRLAAGRLPPSSHCVFGSDNSKRLGLLISTHIRRADRAAAWPPSCPGSVLRLEWSHLRVDHLAYKASAVGGNDAPKDIASQSWSRILNSELPGVNSNEIEFNSSEIRVRRIERAAAAAAVCKKRSALA